MKTRAFLRADASREIGLGHLSRSIAIAKALEAQDIEVTIYSRDLDGLINGHKKFPKVCWINSEEEFLFALYQNKVHYLFVDLLSDSRYKTLVDGLKKIFTKFKTICFDSFFDDQLNFDLFIGPSFDGTSIHPNGISGFKYFVIPDELRLLGPLKPEFTIVRRVLITFGGSDPFGATPVAIKMLCGAFPDIQFTAVVGPVFSTSVKIKVEEKKLQFKNLSIANSPENLGKLYLETDIAVISGGQTKFEAAFFGVPSIIFSNSPQEMLLSKQFCHWGSAIFIGNTSQIRESALIDKFSELLNTFDLLRSMSTKGRKMIDGTGGERIVSYILQNLNLND